MLFLNNINPKTKNVMPINFLYCNEHNYKEDDVLSVVYKDMDTNQTFVENIVKPKIRVWIVKPEYRKRFSTARDFIAKKYLEEHIVRYRNRFSEIKKLIGVEDKDLVKVSPWVLGSDVDIRTFYAQEFLREYFNDKRKPMNLGFLDIENDTIYINRFPQPGECPINCVTVIDDNGRCSYTFILRPHQSTGVIDPETGEEYDNRDQVKALEEDQENFIRELHQDFDESYGEYEYNILFFDKEISLIRAIFKIIEESQINYCLIWNLPYDMSNLTRRPDRLFFEAKDLICSNKFAVDECKFVEDTNPIAHKRKHTCQITHPTCFLDQMVIYAGIRSARGKIPSLKLGAIGKKELGDEKLNYEEEGDIRTFPYVNFRKFVKYNIKDVLLQVGLEHKTGDMDDVYTRIYTDGLLPNEIFTSTKMLTNAAVLDYEQRGYIVGNNRNKFSEDLMARAALLRENPGKTEEEIYEEMSNDESDEPDLTDRGAPDSEESEEEESTSSKKRKKQFEGAMVQNPNIVCSTGVRISNVLNDKIHDYVIDQDVTSLYPTLMILMNMSNETMIGRVEFADIQLLIENVAIWNPSIAKSAIGQSTNKQNLVLPLYNYRFLDSEERAKYSINLSDTFCQMIATNAITEIGSVFMGLPTAEEFMQILDHELTGAELEIDTASYKRLINM